MMEVLPNLAGSAHALQVYALDQVPCFPVNDVFLYAGSSGVDQAARVFPAVAAHPVDDRHHCCGVPRLHLIKNRALHPAGTSLLA